MRFAKNWSVCAGAHNEITRLKETDVDGAFSVKKESEFWEHN